MVCHLTEIALRCRFIDQTRSKRRAMQFIAMTDSDHQPELEVAAIGQDEFLARRRGHGLSPREQASRYGVDGQGAANPIAREVLHERLEAMVFMVLPMRRSVRPSAEALSWFPGPRVERMLVQIELVGRTSLEWACHLCVYAPEALCHLPDEDGHPGDYGIADTRQAVLQARSQGVQPFCITIDDQAQRCLPHLSGAASCALVEDVAKLPYRVCDIYRRITA
mgnify:FL=1